jgi:predicted NUDIX family NTP pyrophosphohydrolase
VAQRGGLEGPEAGLTPVPRRSAGLLLYRRGPGGLEVLLAHPGGPMWANRDEGAWSLPKGEVEEGEAPLAVARREFQEETGHPPPDGETIELGEVKQKSGKLVAAWAAEGDLDPATAESNTFPLQWPPGSGRWITIPEVDHVEWFTVDDARRKLNPAQVTFVDRLVAELAGR